MFVPFVVSVDGLISQNAESVLKRLAGRLANKWMKPYSVVKGLVNARVSFALVRSLHLCLRGSRVPARRTSGRRYFWDDIEGGYYHLSY